VASERFVRLAAMRLHRKRFGTVFAMLAMAMQVLLPVVAQARPGIAGELVPVCSFQGTTHYIELPAENSGPGERSRTQAEHCKLCVFGTDRNVAVQPARMPLLFACAAVAYIAWPPESASPQSPLHALAQSRAPPFAS
jgi:hypothetical protein